MATACRCWQLTPMRTQRQQASQSRMLQLLPQLQQLAQLEWAVQRRSQTTFFPRQPSNAAAARTKTRTRTKKIHRRHARSHRRPHRCLWRLLLRWHQPESPLVRQRCFPATSLMLPMPGCNCHGPSHRWQMPQPSASATQTQWPRPAHRLHRYWQSAHHQRPLHPRCRLHPLRPRPRHATGRRRRMQW